MRWKEQNTLISHFSHELFIDLRNYSSNVAFFSNIEYLIRPYSNGIIEQVAAILNACKFKYLSFILDFHPHLKEQVEE